MDARSRFKKLIKVTRLTTLNVAALDQDVAIATLTVDTQIPAGFYIAWPVRQEGHEFAGYLQSDSYNGRGTRIPDPKPFKKDQNGETRDPIVTGATMYIGGEITEREAGSKYKLELQFGEDLPAGTYSFLFRKRVSQYGGHWMPASVRSYTAEIAVTMDEAIRMAGAAATSSVEADREDAARLPVDDLTEEDRRDLRRLRELRRQQQAATVTTPSLESQGLDPENIPF